MVQSYSKLPIAGCSTVTVIVKGAPTQPSVEVGLTTYSTEPVVALFGIDRVCSMFGPEPPEGGVPSNTPVLSPIVHENVLVGSASKLILVDSPLQMFIVEGEVMTGVGLTVNCLLPEAVPHEPPLDVSVRVTGLEYVDEAV